MATAQTRDGILDVPIIDITPFRDPDADARALDEVARAVDTAARTVGFMQVVGHGIETAVIEKFTAATDAFFALDQDSKTSIGARPALTAAIAHQSRSIWPAALDFQARPTYSRPSI